MLTKICGITTLQDGLFAAANGAWAVGFNFYSKSQRYITMEKAREIALSLPGSIIKVGVFINENPSNIMKALGFLDLVQIYEDIPLLAECKKRAILALNADKVADLPPESILQEYGYLLLDAPKTHDGLMGGTGKLANWELAKNLSQKYRLILAGGLKPDNLYKAISYVKPLGVDVASGVERSPGVKDENLVRRFINEAKNHHSKKGYFGEYGGCYAPETLLAPLAELEQHYLKLKDDSNFIAELSDLLKNYVGRPTPLYFASRLSEYLGGAKIYLKREDLAHTGAHKINNTIGQGLLAKYMGKKRIIAETGAGQHGVATASVASLLGMECVVYMGAIDIERQRLNVIRMQALGANVRAVNSGSKTLKDATSEAMRDWVANLKDSYYVIGSALGPHPYPTIVRDFQKIIGFESKKQIVDLISGMPDELVACVGGGSNAIGLFYTFLEDSAVKMTGIEAGGRGSALGDHAARFLSGTPGVLQGTKSYLLQDKNGNVASTHSISAGLDYPSIGPEHAYLHDAGRVNYSYASDEQAIEAAFLLARLEGIIPALESAHAIAYAIERAPALGQDYVMLVGLSGRGDKDVETLSKYLKDSI